MESRIPQFVLELDNDYINTNRGALEAHENPKEALCDPTSSLRESLPPGFSDDIFKKLLVDNNRGSIQGQKGWSHARRTLLEILECPAALSTCEHFCIDIYLHGIESNKKDLIEPDLPPSDVPNLFVDVFESIPNLQSIEWKGPYEGDAAAAFKQVFSDRSLSLNTVKQMKLAPDFLFLSDMAPNLESLSPCDGYDWRGRVKSMELFQNQMIKAAHRSNNLKEFTLYATWDRKLVRMVHEALPRLEKLAITGSIIDESLKSRYDEDVLGYMIPPKVEGYPLIKLLEALGSFEYLTSLDLPGVLELGMHVSQGGWCGSDYFSCSGTKLGRREELDHVGKAEEASKMVLRVLPRLQELRIEPDCAVIKPGEKPQWPWTGRLREYLVESWPRWGVTDGAEKSDIEDSDGPLFRTWEEDEKYIGQKQGLAETTNPDEN